MKLLVFNIPNTLNYGSMMMAENLFYYLSYFYQARSMEFIVITPKPEETSLSLKQALGERNINIKINTIHPLKIFQGNKVGRIISQVAGIGFKKRLVSELLEINGVVVLGGDDYTEDYGYIGPIGNLLKFRGFVSSGKKVVMCGQTIGPFFSWRKNIMKHLLKNVTKIIARDPLTYNYLTEEFKLKNVLLGSDLAFLPLSGEKDKHSHSRVNPEYYGLKEKYFTIVPSELIWKYAKDPSREVYIDMLTNIALYLFEKYQDYQLLILPHVLAPDSSDDRLAGRDLYINLKRKGIESERMIFLKEQLLPFQARKLLAQSKVVFTGRMHAAISSFACGVPALSLSYSRKYWGIIGEHFGLKELIVDIRDKRWETIEETCKKQIESVFKNEEHLRKIIILKTAEMQQMAMKSIRDTLTLLCQSKNSC